MNAYDFHAEEIYDAPPPKYRETDLLFSYQVNKNDYFHFGHIRCMMGTI